MANEEVAVRKLFRTWLAPLTLFLASLVGLSAQDKEYLHLVQTIPMPNVKGRIDHMDVDVKGKRLFVAGLENGVTRSRRSPDWQMVEKHTWF